jgi:DNA helicase IV
VEQVWPTVDPAALVARLLSQPAELAAAADGVLSPHEQGAISWPRPPRSVRSARWSAADAALIDEAAGLIGRAATFGHVIVDEAQDLSPMQCRAIGRRCTHGSVTVLGDLAQGTAVAAATSWTDTLEHLGKPDARIVPLTTGYRVPAEVLDFANRLLPHLATGVAAAVSLRRSADSLQVREGSVRVLLGDALRECLAREGSIAVIAAAPVIGELTAALAAAGFDVAELEAEGGARITLVPATLAKGLEYDQVVVVEPAEIVEAEPRGLHRLYVVLTRAVSQLVVLHERALPAALTP